MRPGDRRCALCGQLGPDLDIGPGLVALDEGNGQVRYVNRIRCRDRVSCRRRALLEGLLWPVVDQPVTA